MTKLFPAMVFTKLLLCAFALGLGQAYAATLTNGGFETGTLADFTQLGFISNSGGPDSGGPNYLTYQNAKLAAGAFLRKPTNNALNSQTAAFNKQGTAGPAVFPSEGKFLAFVSNTTSAGKGSLTGSEISQTFDIPVGITQVKLDLALLNNDLSSSFSGYNDFGGVALLYDTSVVAQYNLDLDPASSANAHVIVDNAQGGFSNTAPFRRVTLDVSAYQGKTLTLVAYAINYGGDNLTETRLLIDNIVLTRPLQSYDFNGDGRSDILWRDGAGNVAEWLMDKSGLALSANAFMLRGDSGWLLRSARADFNADGKADMVWKNPGQTGYTIWLMDKLNVAVQQFYTPGAGWDIAQLADFNGDGKTDVLWQHANGTSVIWLMDGVNIISSAQIRVAGTGWTATKTADLNGDGKADLIWTHADGSIETWLMNGLAPLDKRKQLEGNNGWQVTEAGDLDGDGKMDLILTHTNGTVGAWLMNGSTISKTIQFVEEGSGWAIDRLADFNGDRKIDILWKHADGTFSVWLMNGFQVIGGQILREAYNGYIVDQIGDYNGDGKADILWRDTVNGTIFMWQMDASLPLTITYILDGSGSWRPTSE